MAEIRKIMWMRHLRSEPTAHILRYRRGRLLESGTGLAFWFYPMNAAVAEVPTDDKELPFLVHGKSADFQDVAVQGEIHYRIADPEALARLIDFSIDLRTGRVLKNPLDQIATMLTGQCQQVAMERVTRVNIRELLVDGPAVIRAHLEAEFRDDARITEMGIEVVTVRVAAVSPTAELEKALQTPTREQLQQAADQATFERRAVAVEKERAIAENELQNQIELARREEALIEQQGLNARRRAEEEAAAEVVGAETKATTVRMGAQARAEQIRLVEGAKVAAERDRLAEYRELAPEVILGLAAQELAGKLNTIEHLNITPDVLATGLANLLQRSERAGG